MMPGIQGIHPVLGAGGGTSLGPFPGHGSFDFDGTDDYIQLSSAPVTAEPFTIMAWMRTDSTATQALCALGNSGGTSRAQLDLRQTDDDVTATAVNSGGASGVAGGGDFNQNTWTLVVGVFTSSTSRDAYQGSTLVDNDTQSITLSGLNSFIMGSRYSGGSRGSFFNGRLAHVAIWDIALSGSDVTALAAGATPDTVQASDLVFYAPLTNGNARDEISGTPLTVSGATSNTQVSPAGA